MTEDEALSPQGLFAVPPGDFVVARDRLVKALRAAKRGAEADAIKRLARPSASVWATNQVARSAPHAVRDLLDAADTLRRAQATGDARDLRAAAATHRERLDALGAEATRALTATGQRAAPVVIDRVLANFRDGALAPDAREPLVAGRLARDVEPLDIGVLLGQLPMRPATATRRPSASPSPPTPPPPRTVSKPPLDAAAARTRRAAEEARRRLTLPLDEARRASDLARRATDRAQDRREGALRKVEEARAALQTAERALADADRAHAESANLADENKREFARVQDTLSRLPGSPGR